LKMETVFVVIPLVCFFFCIYFVVLSLCVIVDELLKVQLLALASSFLVAGVVIAILSIVSKLVGMRVLR
jgi:hypothetical protein